MGEYREDLEEAALEVIRSRNLPIDPATVPQMSDTALATILDLYVGADGDVYPPVDFELPTDPDAVNRLFGLTDESQPPEPRDWRERLDRLDDWERIVDSRSRIEDGPSEAIPCEQDDDPEG